MKEKAAAAASEKIYRTIGSSCLDVQIEAWSALAESRVGLLHSLFAQKALRNVEPNGWLTNLPYSASSLNFLISLKNRRNFIRSPQYKAIIEVAPGKNINEQEYDDLK